ncbi:MAG: hypothetical protein K0S65_734 [Labilithrix sp.]|nr:hypothetical protein [Labilithrix sp.]
MLVDKAARVVDAPLEEKRLQLDEDRNDPERGTPCRHDAAIDQRDRARELAFP